MNAKKQTLGILAALIANFIFGFSFIFSKLALENAEPLVILSARFTISFLVLNFLLLTGRFKIELKGKPKLKLILMGLMQPFFYFIFELYGLSLVSSALSGVIISLVPVLVMLLATVFLNEKPSFLQIVCTVLSIIGVSAISVISNDGSKNYLLGVILLIGAVVCAAFFNILSRYESKNFSPFERTYVMFLLAAAGFNAISFIRYRAEYLPKLFEAAKTPQFLIAVFYLAVLSSVVAFLLYNYSTTQISVLQSSSFSNIITVVTVLAGILILKENFGILECVLCLLIILGVWGVNSFTPENKK